MTKGGSHKFQRAVYVVVGTVPCLLAMASASDVAHAYAPGENSYAIAPGNTNEVTSIPVNKPIHLYEPVSVTPVAQAAPNGTAQPSMAQRPGSPTTTLAGNDVAAPVSEGAQPAMGMPIRIRTTRNVPVTDQCLISGPWSHESARGSMMIPQAHGLQLIHPGKETGDPKDTDQEKGDAGEEDDMLVKWDGKDDRESTMSFNIYFRFYQVL